MQSHIRKVYACFAIACHLHFWQNDRDILRATAAPRGWNRYRNQSQHRKSTLEKKILPPFLQGFEPATFQSRVWHYNHWAISASYDLWYMVSRLMSQKQWLKYHLSLALCLLLFARVIIQLKMLHCVYTTPDFTPKPNLEDCSCLRLDCIQCQRICQHARSGVRGQGRAHTPSTAFRHLPPNSARFGYATEGALFISAQLSTDAVSALRKVRILIRLWKQPSAQART